MEVLLKSAGTPIDAFSFETVELLRDTQAHWATMRMIRNSAAFKANTDPKVAAALRIPDAEIYAIDVSFAALKDKAEFDYLNSQPTTFVLTPEAVDRLRAAAGTIISDSPEFQRLLKDVGAKIVAPPAGGGTRAGAANWPASSAPLPIRTTRVAAGAQPGLRLPGRQLHDE